MRRASLAASTLALLAFAPDASGATLTPVGDFTDPVFVTSDPSDPNRLFVVEQAGRVQLSENGVSSTFLDLAGAGMVAAGGERGLLSMAPAPDFATSGRFYVYYTRDGSSGEVGDIQIDEYTASGDSAPLSSRRPILTIDHPAGNHNGGQLQFGPDGRLYLGIGDGGGSDDPNDNGQNLETLLGTVLRIDPRPSGSAPYSIPGDNPFVGTSGRDEIWSWGLRNPWRFSFDRLTQDLLIGDVGQNAREEVDFRRAPAAGRGDNFGWDCREGLIAHSPAASSCASATGLVDPIFDYEHSGGACSITGGYVVRDSSLGDLYGRYLFADHCVGAIRSLVPATPRATDVHSEGLSVNQPSSFGEDSCGRVYVASLGADEVLRFDGAAPPDCSAPTPPGSARSCAGRRPTRVPAADGSVIGSPGSDVIVADGERNRIRAKGGDDVICALGGNDKILGGQGDDRIRAGRGDDRCRGGGGKDRLRSCRLRSPR